MVDSAIWMQIRVALLPKPDGGLRPISVASAAYRACMTCLLRECRPWFMSWADEELVGGVPGRDMSLSHDSLFLRCSLLRAAADLCTALQAAAVVDKALALTTHPDKLASCSSPNRPFAALWFLISNCLASPTCSGVIDAASISEVVTRRCCRIALAARTLLLRRHFLRALVISLIAWIGPWATVPAKTCSGLARSVEAAVGHTVSARSRLLLWTAWARLV